MGKVVNMEVSVPEGRASKSVYLVQYDEELWMKYDDAGKEFCYRAWIKKAEPLEVEEVVLKLFPDPLLPMHGHEIPYIAWRHRFTETIKAKYEILTPTVRVRIPSEQSLTVALRTEILKELRDKYVEGTKYDIFYAVPKTKTAVSLAEGEL